MLLRTLVVVMSAITFFATTADAQKFPEKEIHFYVGFPPGTSPDLVARFLANKLRSVVGKPVLVENKVGAGGNIAAELVSRANPDGHTLVMSTGGPASYNVHLFKRLGYDPLVNLSPISGVASNPFLLMVSDQSGIKTVLELIARLRTKGKVTFGGNGTSSLVAGELFRNAAQFEAVQVNYRDNSGLVQDLIAGNIDYGFVDSAFGVGLAREGRVKGLAVAATQRLTVAPEYPTLAEFGMPDVVMSGWFAIFAPEKTPPDVVKELNGIFREILADEDVKVFLEKSSYVVRSTSPEELRTLQRDAIEKWGEYTRALKIESQ